MKDDKYYMNLALIEAKKSLKYEDVPVGAIIVKNNKVISKAYNLKEKTKIATKHAEINVINKACKKVNSWYLDDCTLYVTLEPCLMCVGALIQSRVKTIVYAAKNEKFGYITSVEKINKNRNNHKLEIRSGVLEKESEKLLKEFFKDKRKC